jgi:hypothetical protein
MLNFFQPKICFFHIEGFVAASAPLSRQNSGVEFDVEARIDFAVTLPSNNGFSFLLLSGDSQNRRRLPHQGLDSVSNIVPDALRPFDRGGGDANHNSGQRFEMTRIIRAVLAGRQSLSL